MQTFIFVALIIVSIALSVWVVYDIRRQGGLSSANGIAILAIIVTLAMAAYSGGMPSSPPPPTPSVSPSSSSSESTPTPEIILLSNFKVTANKQKNATGILVSEGDLVHFEYLEGKWSGNRGVGTFIETCRSQFSDRRNYPIPPKKAGNTLIGYIGAEAFWIGCEPIDVEANTSGELMLGMNDCRDCFSDNVGEVYVSITVKRK